MHRLARLLIVAVCCLPAMALAQTVKEPAKDTKAAKPKPAPVSATPERTTASFGDWTLRCERVAQEANRVCEVAYMITPQGQNAPIAQVAIGKQPSADARQLTIVLPPNIAIGVKPQVMAAKAGLAPVELTWQRCVPGACFASAPLPDRVAADLAAQTEPGRLVFKNAADQEIVLLLSPRGLSQALTALAAEH